MVESMASWEGNSLVQMPQKLVAKFMLMQKNLTKSQVVKEIWAWESGYLGSSLGHTNLPLDNGQAYLSFWDSACICKTGTNYLPRRLHNVGYRYFGNIYLK